MIDYTYTYNMPKPKPIYCRHCGIEISPKANPKHVSLIPIHGPTGSHRRTTYKMEYRCDKCHFKRLVIDKL